jgi:CBS domain-containing protein
MRAADIMTQDVVSIAPSASIAEAVRLMLEQHVSALPVLENSGLVGIISEGDLLRRDEIGTERRKPRFLELLTTTGSARAADYVKTHGRRVDEVMSRAVITVDADTTLPEIARIMEKRRVRRVPVLRDGRLVGIVSRANLLQALASRLAAEAPPERIDDRRIREALLAEIARQSWATPGEASVIVVDGVVNFWGLVGSEAKRKAMMVAAENVPGVVGVEDHMEYWREIDPLNRPNWQGPSHA